MASQSYLLRNVDVSQDELKLKARVSRLWDVRHASNYNDLICTQMLLIDEEGAQIVATVKKRFIDRFRPLLTEGDAYVFKNFKIEPAKEYYKVVQNDNTLYFHSTTSINPIVGSDVGIPRDRFDFLPFHRLPERCDNKELLTDVVGVVKI